MSNKITPISIKIPREFNSIGIIDGQHRLYAYHEANDRLDNEIGKLRERQHLLVTGIVYPSEISESKRQEFEALLFLEINDRQKRVKGDLKQAIERIINPYSAIAIAKAVVAGLASSGPLVGKLEMHFYDTRRIKTTSIVSYGMKHIVGLESEHSLFKVWRGGGKRNIRRSKSLLDKYVNYCISEINKLICGFKDALPSGMWTTDKKVSRALTTTTINGLIFCLRKLIENRKTGDYDYYKREFEKMMVDFEPEKFVYKSSNWKSLGEKIYYDCFE